MQLIVRRVSATVALLAAAVWLGGLVALGAIAAPVVFSLTPFPSSADAMTTVFRRFDVLAMGCAAILLAMEAARAAGRPTFGPVDSARIGVGVCAAALAVIEGLVVSPRIASFHMAGVIRGLGEGGVEMNRLHKIAEACGKAEVILLVAFVVFSAVTLSVPTLGARVDGGSTEP